MSLWAVLTLVGTLLVWVALRHTTLSAFAQIPLAGLAMILVALGQPQILAALAEGYPNDSFWTLQTGGRAGVIAITVVGLATIFLLIALKSRLFQRWPSVISLPVDMACGLLLFSLVFSLSPQVYYTLYQFIFDGLPSQVVVDSPFNFERVANVARLLPSGAVADHIAGLAFWAVLPFTLWAHATRH